MLVPVDIQYIQYRTKPNKKNRRKPKNPRKKYKKRFERMYNSDMLLMKCATRLYMLDGSANDGTTQIIGYKTPAESGIISTWDWRNWRQSLCICIRRTVRTARRWCDPLGTSGRRCCSYQSSDLLFVSGIQMRIIQFQRKSINLGSHRIHVNKSAPGTRP